MSRGGCAVPAAGARHADVLPTMGGEAFGRPGIPDPTLAGRAASAVSLRACVRPAPAFPADAPAAMPADASAGAAALSLPTTED